MNDHRLNNIARFKKRNIDMTTTNTFFKLKEVSNREKQREKT
jgi:hypothetical protein